MNNIGFGIFCFGEEFYYKGALEKADKILTAGFDCYILTENPQYFINTTLKIIKYDRTFKSYHDKMILPKHILQNHDYAILIDADSRIINYDFIDILKTYKFKYGITYIDTLLNHSAKKQFVKDLDMNGIEWSSYKLYAEKADVNFGELETIWEHFLVINKEGFNHKLFYKYYEKLQLAKEFSDLPMNKEVNGAGEGITIAISAKQSTTDLQKDEELYQLLRRKIIPISKRHTPKSMWPSFML